MMRWPRLTAISVGVSLLALGWATISCASLDRTVLVPPEVEGAHFVGNQTCADCHTNYARIFPVSPHGRFYRDDPAWAGKTGCESCHGPLALHASDDLESRHIQELLEAHGGHRRTVANILGVSERTLYRKLNRYQLRR